MDDIPQILFTIPVPIIVAGLYIAYRLSLALSFHSASFAILENSISDSSEELLLVPF